LCHVRLFHASNVRTLAGHFVDCRPHSETAAMRHIYLRKSKLSNVKTSRLAYRWYRHEKRRRNLQIFFELKKMNATGSIARYNHFAG
jgi:hypothetical protein